MRPNQAYQQVSISTADPLRVVVLLYEGAIKNLNQCIELWGRNDRAASDKLVKTLDIIHYLRTTLDHERAGEIAENLDRLYEYMRDRLNEANINRDAHKVREVNLLLQTLLEGWHGIANQTPPDDAGDEPQPSRPVSMMG